MSKIEEITREAMENLIVDGVVAIEVKTKGELSKDCSYNYAMKVAGDILNDKHLYKDRLKIIGEICLRLKECEE
jgi:hypothetical protein